jgi:hypothetical protein
MFDKNIWKSIKTFCAPEHYSVLPCPYCLTLKLKIDMETFDYTKVPDNHGNFIHNQHKSNIEGKFKKSIEESKGWEILLNGVLLVDDHNYVPGKFIAFWQCENCAGAVAVTGSCVFR